MTGEGLFWLAVETEQPPSPYEAAVRQVLRSQYEIAADMTADAKELGDSGGLLRQLANDSFIFIEDQLDEYFQTQGDDAKS